MFPKKDLQLLHHIIKHSIVEQICGYQESFDITKERHLKRSWQHPWRRSLHSMPKSRNTSNPFYCLIFLLCEVLILPRAQASKPRRILANLDSSQCADSGLIRVLVKDITLEGTPCFKPDDRYRLVVDGKTFNDPPLKTISLAQSEFGLHLVLLIQTNDIMREAFEEVRQGVYTLLDRLPKRSALSLLAYGRRSHLLVKRGKRKQVQKAIANLKISGFTADLLLIDSILTGLELLGPPAPQKLRMIVLFSDGLNISPKRDAFRSVGNRANFLKISIFPIAFSPLDERGPLLNLGEIAKRSLGTFRWAQSKSAIVDEFQNLAQEITSSRLFTFSLASHCKKAHRIAIGGGGLVSNVLETPPLKPQLLSQGSPVAWIVALLGTGLLIVLLFFATRWFLRKS